MLSVAESGIVPRAAGVVAAAVAALFQRKPLIVAAVQWTGENLTALQQLLAPHQSPMYSATTHHLMVYGVKPPDAYATHPLISVKVGHWVIKYENGDVDVMHDDQFRVHFGEAEAEPASLGAVDALDATAESSAGLEPPDDDVPHPAETSDAGDASVDRAHAAVDVQY